MTSNANNYFKTGNKIKFSNIYAFDAYKSNTFSESAKAKTSLSPTRGLSMKETNKSGKNNNILPMMNSYNNHPYKLMDNVKFYYNFTLNYLG
jgi:hypothetical protein